jgi:hypothetical protein
MGIVALKELDDKTIEKTRIFGKRIAMKTIELFGDK